MIDLSFLDSPEPPGLDGTPAGHTRVVAWSALWDREFLSALLQGLEDEVNLESYRLLATLDALDPEL